MNHIDRFIEWLQEISRDDARVDYWLTREELYSSRFISDPWYGITTAINRHCRARWSLTFAFAAVWLAAITYYVISK